MEKLIWKTEKRKVADLIPFDKNPRKISNTQKEKLKHSLEKFGLVEIPAINADNKIVAGHQRLAILKLIGRGQEEIDVRVPSRQLTNEEYEQYLLTSNRVSGEWELGMLNDFDKELLLEVGFDIKEIARILKMGDPKADARLTLADRFVIPPFSILDTKQSYWQDRKRAWLKLTGGLDETREGILYDALGVADPSFYKKKEKFEKTIGREMTPEEYEGMSKEGDILNGGVSIFDPVLTEVMLKWFCEDGGKVLDPFMGDPGKAVVAGELRYGYVGVDIRKEQVDANERVCKEYKGIKLYAGDSNEIDKIVPDNDFDIVFTCPPYYDLEVYSKEDMSALGTYEEFMAQYKNIFKKSIEKLKDNRFLVIVLGEVRDKKTGEYRNFIGDNIQIFKDLGLTYYNEMILSTSIGSLPIRAGRQFNNSRKVGKAHQNILTFYKGKAKDLFKETQAIYAVHQNILAFYKGDPKEIKKEFGDVVNGTDTLK